MQAEVNKCKQKRTNYRCPVKLGGKSQRFVDWASSYRFSVVSAEIDGDAPLPPLVSGTFLLSAGFLFLPFSCRARQCGRINVHRSFQPHKLCSSRTDTAFSWCFIGEAICLVINRDRKGLRCGCKAKSGKMGAKKEQEWVWSTSCYLPYLHYNP